MHKTARLLVGLLRLCGSAALLLGLAFWLGYGRSLTRLHIRLGTAVVLLLLVIAGLAWRAAGVRLVALAVGWGILVWFLGMRQGQILPGSFHWVVEVAHLVVGVGAIALGERLAATVKARSDP